MQRHNTRRVIVCRDAVALQHAAVRMTVSGSRIVTQSVAVRDCYLFARTHKVCHFAPGRSVAPMDEHAHLSTFMDTPRTIGQRDCGLGAERVIVGGRLGVNVIVCGPLTVSRDEQLGLSADRLGVSPIV